MLPICLIVALPAEARPLISYFGLRGMNHPHLRLYQGDNGYLLQTGVGKLNAAAATATMLAALPDVAGVINVGIAGGEHPIGESFVAHSIQDRSTNQQWFPHLPAVRKLAGINSTQVVTVDHPSSDYSTECVYDMEASGVYAAASKVLDLAFVHSVKVVSDNSETSFNDINADMVNDSIGSSVATIEKLMKALPFDTLPSSKEVNALSAVLTKHLHYTATETHALNQLLHRHNALLDAMPSTESLLSLSSAKAIRQILQQAIENANVNY